MSRELHVGPTRAGVERAAFERAAAAATPVPGSVLYVTSPDADTDVSSERWREVGRPIQFRVRDFDGLVADVTEKEFFETRAQTLSGEERQRLVEVAVDSLDDPTHPLASRRETVGASPTHAGAVRRSGNGSEASGTRVRTTRSPSTPSRSDCS